MCVSDLGVLGGRWGPDPLPCLWFSGRGWPLSVSRVSFLRLHGSPEAPLRCYARVSATAVYSLQTQAYEISFCILHGVGVEGVRWGLMGIMIVERMSGYPCDSGVSVGLRCPRLLGILVVRHQRYFGAAYPNVFGGMFCFLEGIASGFLTTTVFAVIWERGGLRGTGTVP